MHAGGGSTTHVEAVQQSVASLRRQLGTMLHAQEELRQQVRGRGLDAGAQCRVQVVDGEAVVDDDLRLRMEGQQQLLAKWDAKVVGLVTSLRARQHK